MSKRQAASPDSVPTPAGPYSPSVRIGNWVACSGQAGITPEGEMVQGFANQVRQTFTNVISALEASGASSEDVLHVRVYLVDPSQFAQMNTIYEKFFEFPFPARTTVYVGLPVGLQIEVDALAVIKSS